MKRPNTDACTKRVPKKQPRKTYLFSLETKRATHDDCKEREPAHAIPGISWEGEEGSLDERDPDRLDGPRDDRSGDKAEGNGGNE